MSHSHTSAVCPGSENLLSGHGRRYLRVIFTAYWNQTAPSAEVLYLTRYPLEMSYKGIKKLEDFALTRLQGQDPDALRVIYLGYVGVELDDDDVKELGWRVIVGAHEPSPVEQPITPKTNPSDPSA